MELDYEYILLFKKPGPSPKITPERKSASRLTTEEWKQFFAGHWNFGGARQSKDGGHDAMFPDELPRRLIRMFSFVGDTVLDPFLAAARPRRSPASSTARRSAMKSIPIFCRSSSKNWAGTRTRSSDEPAPRPSPPRPADYRPLTEDAAPLQDPKQFRFGTDQTYKVQEIIDEHTLRLDTGLAVSLLGVRVPATQATKTRLYFDKYLRGKQVLLRFDSASHPTNENTDLPTPAYVQLANKLFINRKMIEMGLAHADRTQRHKYRDRFIAAEEATTVGAGADDEG